MQVLLDDMPCDVTANTVGEAIDAASALADGRGRLIVDVTVDGSRWTEAQLCSPEQLTAEAEVVRLVSADPNQLVRQTLADAVDALGEVDHLQREAAQLLQSDQHTVSMDRLGEAISIWSSVRDVIVKSAQLVGLDLDEVVVNETPITASIGRLTERLQAVRSALEARDHIGLADNLLYEFPDIVDEWRAILERLLQRVQENES
ncbi:MAG: hypothetical protein ACYS0G_07540 [Planctomycetota bacterium]